MGFIQILADTFRRSDSRLFGEWELVRTDAVPADVGEGVRMRFTPDGALDFAFLGPEKDQIVRMVFKVRGRRIITDQPSHPRIEESEYSIEPNGLLSLYRSDATWWFRKLEET